MLLRAIQIPTVNTNILPEDLLADLDNPKTHVRDGAVRELGRLAKSGDQGIVAAVKKVLTQQLRNERDIVVCGSIEEVLADIASVIEEIKPAKVKTVSNSTELKQHKVKSKRYVFAGIGLLLAILAVLKSQYFPYTVDPDGSDVEEEVSIEIIENKIPVRKPGTVFHDVLKDGSKGPEMVVIPQGSFVMGSPENEKDRDKDEGPQHRIEITKPFALGRYEVTLEQFKKYSVDANAVIEDGCWKWDYDEAKWKQDKGASWQKPGFKQDNTHPVVLCQLE